MVTCPKCGYEWQSKATAAWITCPGCQRKFRRPPAKIEVLGRKVPLKSKCDVCGYPYAELNVCRVDGEAAFICDECLARLTSGE